MKVENSFRHIIIRQRLQIPVDEWSKLSTRPFLRRERTKHGSVLTVETWRVIQVSAAERGNR